MASTIRVLTDKNDLKNVRNEVPGGKILLIASDRDNPNLNSQLLALEEVIAKLDKAKYRIASLDTGSGGGTSKAELMEYLQVKSDRVGHQIFTFLIIQGGGGEATVLKRVTSKHTGSISFVELWKNIGQHG